MSGFQVGDCVVCVNTGRIPLPEGGFAAGHKLRLGAIYRVLRTGFNDFGRRNVWVADSHPLQGSLPERFRKIDPASDEFTEQMRALRPHTERVPA